jgi:DNA helicase-2/ATP-dependent DNA helicase PcrA
VNPIAAAVARVQPDDRQREAIEHIHGPMLVLAGAGTGKTTVLTQRIAHLVAQGHASPGEILALTYTENAAEEMKKRVQAELEGQDTSGLKVVTFHAWCNNLLHRRGANFGVLDDKDLWVYLRRNIRELRLRYFVRAANVSEFLEALLSFMRRCQDELVAPEQYAEYVKRLERGEIPLQRVTRSKKQSEMDPAEVLDRCREISSVYAAVERMLSEKNFGTFGHMITRAYQLLKHDAALLEEERSKTRFVLVDEFQDANFAQVEILSLLAGSAANVFAVGDPDQAIYRFRGASSAAFTLFARHFPSTRFVMLEKNRRSLSPILQCAFGIVNDNPPVFSQKGNGFAYQRAPLGSEREAQAIAQADPILASPVEIVTWGETEVEAADLAYQIKQKRSGKDKNSNGQRCAWSDFAVLYRQHNHREELVREFTERGIPFSIEALDVLHTPEVRDLIACLTAAVSPRDAASLFRVAALRQFDMDGHELRTAMRAARRDELEMREVLHQLANGSAVLACVDQAHDYVEKPGVRAVDAARFVSRHFALANSAPLSAFLNFVDLWQTKPIVETGVAGEFLDYLDYFTQAKGTINLPPTTSDAVRLLTVHTAKGLEFRHVAIIRAYSPCFPGTWREPLLDLPPELRTSGSDADDKAINEEEERRLFYVAMTRAKDTLTIYTHQGRAKKDPTPTKFMREFMPNPAYRQFWRSRPAAAVQDDLFGGQEEKIALEHSNVAAWLLMPPSDNFFTGLSASAITTYEMCPLRFKLEREWNLPRDVPAALHYGKVMHDVLRTFHDSRRFGREVADSALLEQLRQGLADAGIADRYQYELYLKQGTVQLEQFLELVRTVPQPEVLQTEQSFDLQIAGTNLRGRVDRIDRANEDGVAIVDYKTGKPKSQEDADESLQLSLYAIAAREVWGYRISRLLFYNLENNSAVVTTRNDAELDEARLKVQKVAEAIAEGKFEAKPGNQCAFCPYNNLCPATEKIVLAPLQKAPRPN